jgi:phthiocerol/phenolphthiocerol synthesis type-I polyketide synthase E
MQGLPEGSMLVVPLPEERVQPCLDDRISLAVINGPSLCVVSGEEEAIRDLELQLQGRGIESRHLHTSHAFHSQMMAPILEPFAELVKTVKLNAPRIPFVSSVTGTWITPDDATDPGYWARHLRQTVRFSDCLQTLLQDPKRVLLEVGPGRTLATLAMQHPARDKRQVVLASTRHPKEEIPDLAFLLDTLGQLWLAGVPVDWSGFYADERRRRVSLPTYPFERKRYWISPGKQMRAAVSEQAASPQTPETAVVLVDRDADGSADPHGMPCSDVERTLAEMWHRLLGVDGLTTSDNFFEIGGSSLLATRLFTQIAQIYRKRLPLSTIFEAPTIGQLASILDRDAGPSAHTSLVKVQEGQSRPAFFCLPGNLGNVFADLGYLSRHLGSDQPVYGLQDGIGHRSAVPALAAHYVEDICRSQPGGPYLLGGVCSGGVVAFEMARQLRQQGCEVALLALVEPASLPLSGARSYLDLFSEIWHRFLRRRSARSRETSRLSLAEKAIYVRLKLKLLANLWGLKRYVPQAYPGHFHLYLTRESLEHSPRPRWCDLADGGASVHEIPGTHRTITGDDVPIDDRAMRVLGESLRKCIDAALQGEASDAAGAAGVDRVTVGMRPLEGRFR